jgi:hypothetical protein
LRSIDKQLEGEKRAKAANEEGAGRRSERRPERKVLQEMRSPGSIQQTADGVSKALAA